MQGRTLFAQGSITNFGRGDMVRSSSQYGSAIPGPLPTAGSAPSAVRTWPALLAVVSLAALATVAPYPAHAVDGTWTGGGAPVPNEWTQDNNWTSATVPDNTAAFTNNAAPTSVTISNAADINTILFTGAAPAYFFTNSDTFNVNGAGIVNNSAFAPT